MNRPLPLTEMRLAHLLTLEPHPMTTRIRSADGGAYAWTDDSDLCASLGAVMLRRPHLPPVYIWEPPPEGTPAPTAADVIDAIMDALDDAQTWCVDVRAIVARLMEASNG